MKPQPLNNEHLAVQDLLPAHAAGALPQAEQDRVRQHLQQCAECRNDAALGQRLRAAEPAAPAGLDADAALARLMGRLDEAVPVAPAAVSPPAASHGSGSVPVAPSRLHSPATHVGEHTAAQASRSAVPGTARAASAWRFLLGLFNGGGWRNWALAGQLAVIAGLAVLVLRPAGDEAAYRALGSGGGAAAPDVVVMFQPDAHVGQVQRLLQASGARIVDGPTVTGAYLLDVDAAHREALLAALRAEPSVRMAEPLGAGTQP